MMNGMAHLMWIGLTLILVVGSTALPVGVSASERMAGAPLRACAARPVPLPPSRPVSSEAQRRIDARVQTWRENRSSRFPGISVAIRWDDGREVTSVSGVADRNSGRKVAAGTPFALASVSKPFTAAIALLLDACGLMPLDTRVSSLVPYADVRADATVEDLLRHESGMSDWLTDKSWRMDWLIKHPNSGVGPKGAVQGLLPRGERGDFDYSNSGFTLITLAAERATGTSWQKLMEMLLLKPMQLKETGFGPVAGAARTHIWSRGAMRPFGSPGWGPTRSVAGALRGAGDLFSTPRDLARFGELLWGDRLLEGTQNEVINGVANLTGLPWSYTLGSMMDRSWLGGLRTYGHTGGYSGASTTLRRAPELGVTVAVTGNGMGTTGNYADDLAMNLIEMLDQPAPTAAQAIAQRTVGGSASSRANPEPFGEPDLVFGSACGNPLPVGDNERWIDLAPSGGEWSGSVNAMEQLPDGRLLVVGSGLTRADGVRVQGAAVRSATTGTWASFAGFRRSDGSVATVTSVALDRTRGLLYVGGDFTLIQAGTRRVRARGVAQLDLQLGTWTPMKGGVGGRTPHVTALAVDAASGALAVVGSFTTAGGKRSPAAALWRVGSGWTAINAPGTLALSGMPQHVAVAPNGSVSVAGYVTVGSTPAYLARWTPNALGWRILATSSALATAPSAMSIGVSGELIVGTGVGWYGASLIRESQLSGYGWERLGSGVSRPRKASWITALAATHTGDMLVGGSFSYAGPARAVRVARWSATSGEMFPIGEGLSTEPDALTSSTDALAYAALRVRGSAGTPGRTCITAWAAPAPSLSPTPQVTVARRGITISLRELSAEGRSGFVAVVVSPNGTRRTCVSEEVVQGCTVRGLTPNTKYRVSVSLYSVPAGPAPSSAPVVARTKR
jgi:CubicO group peptidase (beta-lactamase class C family)